MTIDVTRVPVIVGVGEINDRPTPPEAGRDSAQLMLAALVAADADAGGGWMARCDRLLVVPQISFRDLDVSSALSAGTGLVRAAIELAAMASGDTPVRLLADAANLIGAGAVTVCAITGGEALRTAAARGGGALFRASGDRAMSLRARYGLVTPSEIYPLYENALRAERGQSLEAAQAETGRMWAAMSEVAAEAKGAWLKLPRRADEIVESGGPNRPIAFPYTKLMVANASVNQGAAAIVTSLQAARDAGVPDTRLVHIGASAAAHEANEPMDRASWTTSPAMRVSLKQALARGEMDVEDIDLVELYSCFPCVPKMARQVLGWPLDRPITVHGGLTFGGGPIGNYMGHALAAMVRRLRGGTRRGLLFANGGYCSHNHTILLGGAPTGVHFPQDYDAQAQADAARGAVPPLTDAVEGTFPVETYTVIYDRAGEPAYGVAVSRAPSGERVVARVAPDNAAAIATLTDGTVEPVGRLGRNARLGDTLVWSAPA